MSTKKWALLSFFFVNGVAFHDQVMVRRHPALLQHRSRNKKLVLHENGVPFLDYTDPSIHQVTTNLSSTWGDLCRSVSVTPQGITRLEVLSPSAIRGVYLNNPVRAGEVIFTIPLLSCLRDDQPPIWMRYESSESDTNLDYTTLPHPQCSSNRQWSSRLAAAFIDQKLKSRATGSLDPWLHLLPSTKILRASLPVHWPEETIQSARCSALELIVDTSYFTRAEALQDLMDALVVDGPALTEDEISNSQLIRDLCHNALDIVQTRSCRVMIEDANGSDPRPVRLLAPVFDFINHHCYPNAEFYLKNNDQLVVRALTDLNSNDQILIDYGESTRPDWRCLCSYGFVPTYHGADDISSDDQAVAEAYMDGVRYEVTPSSIPEAMVAAVMDSCIVEDQSAPFQDKVELTPKIAVRLARRLADASYHLLLDPPGSLACSESAVEHDDVESQPLESIVSLQLAASLRWNQHRIQMASSMRLRDWAMENRQI